jgi:hypothetical protein
MEAITRIAGLISGFLTSPADLTLVGKLATLGALTWNVGILVWVRALASRQPAVRECDSGGEYDEAA